MKKTTKTAKTQKANKKSVSKFDAITSDFILYTIGVLNAKAGLQLQLDPAKVENVEVSIDENGYMNLMIQYKDNGDGSKRYAYSFFPSCEC